MIIALEWWICVWKTSIWKMLAEKFWWIYIQEHTPYIKDTKKLKLTFKNFDEYLVTFLEFLKVEENRLKNIDVKNNLIILDRSIYSLLAFAYSKWKKDNIDYSQVLDYVNFENIHISDLLIIIHIDSKERINRLNKDIIRKNKTPKIFYDYDFNIGLYEYLNNIYHNKKYLIEVKNENIEHTFNKIFEIINKEICIKN